MRTLLLSLALLATPVAAVAADAPKNVIVMIADGAGYNTLAATRYYLGRDLIADGPDWQKAAMATYALRSEADPLGTTQDPELVYASEKAWDATPVAGEAKCKPGFPAGFEGYEWERCTAPDSANTMSNMMTGVRSYNGAINVDGNAKPVLSAAEVAHASGRRVGAMSSVPWTHATPAAGGGAHNPDRNDYHAIAHEMLTAGTLDFIGGGGNPDFDGDGRPVAADAPDSRFGFVSAEDWAALKAGTSGWTLVEDLSAIDALAATPGEGRVMVVPKVAATLQAQRTPASGVDPRTAPPGASAKTPNLPTLPSMTRAALAQMQGDDDGMFLVVEGGAVDWALHANSLGRAIEEYTDFDAAVRTVVKWIETPGNGSDWSNTIVIVTADHDHMLFGPDKTVPFQPVEDRGIGQLPGHSWWSNSHSNQLVPFFVRGAGADAFIAAADREDVAEVDGKPVGRGRYLTQSDMGRLLIELLKK